MDAYMRMVGEARSGRLNQVLLETDACLQALSKRLGAAAPAAAAPSSGKGRGGGAAGPGAGDNGGGGADMAGAWAQLARRLVADVKDQPRLLEGGELRPYQMQGLRWLVGLAHNGLNGILADEMGLGKTVQVIAMICHLVESATPTTTPAPTGGRGGHAKPPPAPAPFLIAAPASVLPNWAAELRRWAPRLRVVEYRGSAPDREQIYARRIAGAGGRFDVLLTSYECLMGKDDRPRLARGREWRCIIIDEGHRLKNTGCKLSRELRAYRSRGRLLLTGTPLQNKLGELWALLNFLMPDMFDSSDDFAAWFGAPLEALREGGGAPRCDAEDAEDAAGLTQEEYLLLTSRLHTVLRPFMLRRLKEAVAGELPPKTEVVLRCQMSAYQQALYDLVANSITGGGGGGGAVRGLGVSVNNALMELRTICNHPLISRLHPELGETLLPPSPLGLPPGLRLSAKVELLDRVLLRMAAGKHKVLLFSTMTRALDELEGYLDWRGWRWLRLDGASGGAAERGELVARFNDPASDVFVFLLSIRAGGVGLNLQAADTVIMYDTDFNPQIDLQAQARAHRIGQLRPVLVVRLVVAASVEEHVLRVGAEKARFADSSITGGFFDGITTADHRRRFLLSILSGAAPPSSAAGPSQQQQPTGAADDTTAANDPGDGAAAATTAVAAGDAGGESAAGSPAAAPRCGPISDAQLSTLLARRASEAKLFEAEDARRAAAEAAAFARWTASRAAAGVGGASAAVAQAAAAAAAGLRGRLAGPEECADMIGDATAAAAPKPKEDPTMFGRGMRAARGGGGGGGQQQRALGEEPPPPAEQQRRRGGAAASAAAVAAAPAAAASAGGGEGAAGSSRRGSERAGRAAARANSAPAAIGRARSNAASSGGRREKAAAAAAAAAAQQVAPVAAGGGSGSGSGGSSGGASSSGGDDDPGEEATSPPPKPQLGAAKRAAGPAPMGEPHAKRPAPAAPVPAETGAAAVQHAAPQGGQQPAEVGGGCGDGGGGGVTGAAGDAVDATAAVAGVLWRCFKMSAPQAPTAAAVADALWQRHMAGPATQPGTWGPPLTPAVAPPAAVAVIGALWERRFGVPPQGQKRATG